MAMIRGIENAQELEQLADLTAQIFCGGNALFTFRERFRRLHQPGLHCRWEDSRIMVEPGRIIAHVGIVDRRVRIGRSELWMGGLGGVWTHPDYRKKGYSARLMHDGVRYMTERGYDASLLFGIPDYYHRFGFAVCFPTFKLILKTQEAKAIRGTLSVRSIRREDVPAVRALYEESNRTRTGTVNRVEAFWDWRERGAPWTWLPVSLRSWHGVFDKAGALVGYFYSTVERNDLYVREVAGRTDEALASMVAFLYRVAHRRDLGRMVFAVSPDHPLALLCSEYDSTMETTYRKNGGGMMRIIHLRSTFEHIAPELSHRLSTTYLSGAKKAFALQTDIGTLGLRCAEGRVTPCDPSEAGKDVLVIPQHRLAPLIVGYVEPCRILSAPEVRVPPGLREWIECLFPKQVPFFWELDHF